MKDDEIEKIKSYIHNENLRGIVSYVKREHRHIYDEVSSLHGSSFTEKLYKYIHGNVEICDIGNKKRFISIKDGYGFCGRASSCQCCKNAVSVSISEVKRTRSKEQIDKENEKRIRTNLKKYGVENTGSIEKAKQKHKELYSNPLRVKTITKKVAKTIKANGTSFKKTEKQKEELRELKRNKELINNPNLSALYCKSTLAKLLKNNTVDDICEIVGCHRTTVLKNMLYHGLRDKRESTLETDMYNWLSGMTSTIIHRNTRSILPSGRELDFYIPEYNMAIEMCGEYYHSDLVREDKNYHMDKFKECEGLGIQLFTIFSNVWYNKNSIIKRMLSHKLNKSTSSIYARKCNIVNVSSKQAREFCENNHLKGYVNSSVKVGLEYNGSLVALMTLGKSRRTIGKVNSDNAFEIYRYVTSENVVGGASKILSHFEKTQNPSTVYSFSDNEYSIGNLYEKLGMKLESENLSYFYYKGGLTFSRNNFQKHKLVERGYDKNKTEKQIMNELGYYRVWDCGTKLWVKHYLI